MKAYDYCNATWRLVAAQQSGEVIIARGEQIVATETLLVTGASGGQALGSGLYLTSGRILDRVIINVPRQTCSGAAAVWGYSGEATEGIYIGGSGHQPFAGNGCMTSGKGLWLPTNGQKEIYVDSLSEVYVVTDPAISGLPITYIAEVIACA